MADDRPDLRPGKRRRGARVLVCTGDRVLLMSDSDPGVPGSSWWVLPGGGIDVDEPSRAAAVRELAEETGHVTRPELLDGPRAHRVAVHGYSDRILVQEEEIFGLRVPEPFAVDTSSFTASEQTRMGQWGWFTAGEMARMEVWPAQTSTLAFEWLGECVELGLMEESTVPVGDADAL